MLLGSPCIHCVYGRVKECPGFWTSDQYNLEKGDKIEIGIPIQGGGHSWGWEQKVLWIDSNGVPWYRAKWGKVNKPAYCYKLLEELRSQQQIKEREQG